MSEPYRARTGYPEDWGIDAPERVHVRHGDSRDVLKEIADCSIDSCVTDPPYSLVSIVKRFGGKNAAPCQEGADTPLFAPAQEPML